MSFVKFECTDCGAVFRRHKSCPVTGIAHGRGWVYSCDYCRGNLRFVKEIKGKGKKEV